jgi:5-(aminomethyl)-3-furanmethanol phosphate kinase
MARSLPLRIVKVGGSLLQWPRLPQALLDWLSTQPRAVHVLVCGGGRLADWVRQADRDFGFAEMTSHWLCIEVLAVTSRLLAALLPDRRLVTTYANLCEWVHGVRPEIIVLDPREFLESHESQLAGTALPHTWQATTDSITARLAEVLSADELVLLKSSDPPAADLAALTAAGYVDGHFPQAARQLARVRFVNLHTV